MGRYVVCALWVATLMATQPGEPYVSHPEPEALIPHQFLPPTADQIRLEAWLIAQALACAARAAAAYEVQGDGVRP